MKRRSNKEKWRRKGTSVTGWDGTERNKGWKRSRKIYMGSKDKRRRKKKKKPMERSLMEREKQCKTRKGT